MTPTNILILSDAPTGNSGLAKICRELAIRIDTMPEFRVATAGLGKTSTWQLPFPNYVLTNLGPGMEPVTLPSIWNDFAQGEPGILLTIWNPGWLTWLSHPENLPDGELKKFLLSKPFKVWSYLPIDAEGLYHKLPMEASSVISRLDRILAYTSWEAQLIANSIGKPVEHLPHGVDTGIFYPSDRQEARKNFLSIVNHRKMPPLHDKIFMVGAVATNTPRKDWGLVYQICRELRDRKIPVALWAHTDSPRKAWDLPALMVECGLEGTVMQTTTCLSDEQMASAYNALDLMIGPGLGEGFGLPLAESLACGVSVVHCNYAGGTEFIPENMLVDPIAFFNEGIYCHQRPVFRVSDWADRIIEVTKNRPDPRKSLLDQKFFWPCCWPQWAQWLREGLVK